MDLLGWYKWAYIMNCRSQLVTSMTVFNKRCVIFGSISQYWLKNTANRILFIRKCCNIKLKKVRIFKIIVLVKDTNLNVFTNPSAKLYKYFEITKYYLLLK